MSTIVIKVENLAKKYRIGEHQRNDTLRDAIAHLLNGNSSRQEKGRRTDQQIWALKNVSFEVEQGEVIGIIGRNGAGKSTLLKILSRITEPSEGRIELNGRVGSLLEVGTGFHPELTGRENIYLSGAILGMHRAEIDSKLDEIIDFSGIEKFIDTPIKRYSSGMNVRLGFAVAAHLEPEILLVDEVLAVGDAAFQQKCLGKMEVQSNEGRTILFVSHNMDAIRRLCPRGLLFTGGILDADEGINLVVNKYLSQPSSQSLTKPLFSENSIYSGIEVAVDGNLSAESAVWQSDQKLSLIVTVKSLDKVPCPRVDVAFYRFDGMKLFAIQSDRILTAEQSDKKRRWIFDLEFTDPGLSSQHIYFDVGVRSDFREDYLILWQRVCEVYLDPGPKGDLVTADSFLVPQISIIATGQNI